jgi:hypothetical protein
MPINIGVSAAAGSLKNPAEPFLLGYKVNWVSNPSFETNIDGWTSVAGGTLSRTTAESYNGTASLQVVNSSASAAQLSNIPLVAGSGFYNVSAYVKLAPGATTANYFIRQLQYENIGGPTVASGNVGTQNLSVTGNWVRLSGIINKAATANYINIRVVTASTTAGDTFFVDAVLFEKGSTASVYFDGDTGFWAGTPHASFSGVTPY